MKLSFMTLGCPTWDLDTICRNGPAMGFDAVDFRGLQEALDITTLPAFTTNIAATRRQLDSAGLAVSGISSSLRVCDPTKRQENLDEARRTIAVALALNVPNIRVFGGGPVDDIGHAAAAQIGVDCMNEVLALDGASSLHWCFETHDHWIKAADCKLLLDAISNPAFGALWDMGHTYRVGGETAEQTAAALSGRIFYAHVKDAVHQPDHPNAMSDGWRYVVPGTGELKLAHAVNVLKNTGYDGYLLFEHEKRWHPDLPEPEVIFPKFVAWARQFI